MNIDIERITRYLMEIKSRRHELGRLLDAVADAALLNDPWKLKGVNGLSAAC